MPKQTRTACKSSGMPDKHNAFILSLLYSKNFETAVIRGNHAIGLIDNFGCNPTKQLSICLILSVHSITLCQLRKTRLKLGTYLSVFFWLADLVNNLNK